MRSCRWFPLEFYFVSPGIPLQRFRDQSFSDEANRPLDCRLLIDLAVVSRQCLQ